MKKERIYTKKMHVYRCKVMLKSGCYCCCPASRGFDLSWKRNKNPIWSNNPCIICKACANLDMNSDCPCYVLGEEEAIRRLNNENLQRKI